MHRWWLALMLTCALSGPLWAFQAAPLADDCNRVENPLSNGSQWAGAFDPDLVGVWQANGTVCTPAVNASTYWAQPQGPRHRVTVDCSDCVGSAANAISLYVGMKSPSPTLQTSDGYRCQFRPNSSDISIYRFTDGGGGSAIAGPITRTYTTGAKLGCQFLDSTISAWLDTGSGWELVAAATNTTHVGGEYVGIFSSTTNYTFDNIGIGPVPRERLGLHVTSDELSVWQQRAVNGPYKSAGDVSTNSPGDWDRIAANATTFLSNPAAGRWAGYTGAGCMPLASGVGPGLTNGVTLRDAAFRWLINGNTADRDAVLNELLAQAAVPQADFSNTTIYSTASGCVLRSPDDSDMQEINAWVQHLVIGYDYIRSSISGANRTTLDTWFMHAGLALERRVNETALAAFPNRATGDYSSSPQAQGGAAFNVVYFGGTTTFTWHLTWSNLATAQMRTSGLIGIMLSDSTLIDSATRYMKEWLAFELLSDNSSLELGRWTTGSRQQGMGYWGGSLSHVMLFADALARAGDTALYTYITSGGMYATVGGGSKSVINSMTRLLEYRDGTVLRYATASAGENGDPTYLIDGEDSTQHLIVDVYAAIINVYLRSAYLASHIERTWAGAPAYPSGNPPGGAMYWGGDQGVLPGLLFQFGQMDGLVWPYKSGIVNSGFTLACGVNTTDTAAFTILTDSCASFPVCLATDSVKVMGSPTTIQLPTDTFDGAPGYYILSPVNTAKTITIDAGFQVEIEWGLAFGGSLANNDVVRCEPRTLANERLTAYPILPTITVIVPAAVASGVMTGGQHTGGTLR